MAKKDESAAKKDKTPQKKNPAPATKKIAPSEVAVDMLSLMEQKQSYEVKWIHYSKLLNNPKSRYRTNGIESLADSIQSLGIQQPLIVKPAGNDIYVITAGHRRKLASIELVENRKLEKYAYLPCIESSKDEDPTITELKLNLTNAFNREFSDYDKMFAISELERLFTEAKKKGIVIKGKMRDNIGEAMGLQHTQVQKYLTIAKEFAKETSLLQEVRQSFQDQIIGVSEVYSKIRDMRPAPIGNDGDAGDEGSAPETSTLDDTKGSSAPNEIAGGTAPQPSAAETKTEDEPFKELKKELSEARKVLSSLKKMLTIIKIPELSSFVKTFEAELEKIEKKIN